MTNKIIECLVFRAKTDPTSVAISTESGDILYRDLLVMVRKLAK